MDIIENSDIKTSNLKNILVDKGIFVVKSFLNLSEIEDLKKEVLSHHSKKGKPYPFGTNYAINNPKELGNKNLQKIVFSKSWMKELFYSYNNGVTKGYFDSIYSTHDFKFD